MAQQVARDGLEQHFEHGVVGHGLIPSGRLRLRPSQFHPRPAAGYSWWPLSFVWCDEIEAGAFGPQGSLTPHGSLLSAAEVGRIMDECVESARIIGGVGALERGDDEARIGALQRVLGLADNPPRAAPTVYRAILAVAEHASEVTFLSGRNRDFSIGHQHPQFGRLTSCQGRAGCQRDIMSLIGLLRLVRRHAGGEHYRQNGGQGVGLTLGNSGARRSSCCRHSLANR